MKKVDIFVSQKMSILSNLKEEVNRLKVENKQLARQLHLDRYVAKHSAQRTINDLKSENLSLQRETAAIRDRTTARNAQAEVHEDIALKKRQGTNDLRLQHQRILDKIRETAEQIELTKQKNEELTNDLTAKNNLVEEYRAQLLEAKEVQDDEIALSKEIVDATQKVKIDIRKLQERLNSRHTEEKHLDEMNEKLNLELAQTEEDIEKWKEKVRRNEEVFYKTENEIRKLKDELEDTKKKQASDSAKCCELLSALHHQPKVTTSAQTDDLFSMDNSMPCELGIGEEGRGTKVRVLGVGGNVKRKFGKDLEVRATSYSRHINLNIKLNK